MKILVVNAFFPPMTTGSAHFALDIAREYARLGHQVHVLSCKHDVLTPAKVAEEFLVTRVRTRWFSPGKLSFNYRLPMSLSISTVRTVKRLFDEFRPDVVHQNGQFFDLTFITSILSTSRGIPRVLTIHTPLTHTNRLAKGLIAAIDRTVIRGLNALGQPRVVAVDKFCRDLVQRRYRPKVPVQFIPATLDVNAFHSGDPRRVLINHRLDGKRVILSFGHVIPIRSRIPLIKALPRILERVPNAQVLVVGHVYDSRFLDLAHELGVEEHVSVVGRVPHAEVPDYLASAEVEVHDLDGHGLGITTFEVMAAGVPIVASVDKDVFPGINLNDWPDVRIRENLDVRQLAEEIVELLSFRRDQKEALIKAQIEFVTANFSTSVVARQYETLFRSMVD